MDCNMRHRLPDLMNCARVKSYHWLRVNGQRETLMHFSLVNTSKMAVDDAYCNPSIDKSRPKPWPSLKVNLLPSPYLITESPPPCGDYFISQDISEILAAHLCVIWFQLLQNISFSLDKIRNVGSVPTYLGSVKPFTLHTVQCVYLLSLWNTAHGRPQVFLTQWLPLHFSTLWFRLHVSRIPLWITACPYSRAGVIFYPGVLMPICQGRLRLI